MAKENTPSLPSLEVAHSPHLSAAGRSTRAMMVDVLIALAPVLGVAVYVFGAYAIYQVVLCTVACVAFETLFLRWRGHGAAWRDGSAALTGVILGLSLPWSAPWYVGIIAAGVAMGIGKAAFGGLGHNLFNPAMVGRAFVMIGFPTALGASAFIAPELAGVDILSGATPLTAAKQSGVAPEMSALFLGNVNGSLGETSALACVVGGIYLCVRRTASWEIPVSMLCAVVALAGLGELTRPEPMLTTLGHLFAGSLIFGAFFIATDPVTSPLTRVGKIVFGASIGALVVLLRAFSGYPEGVMFAVLLANAAVPLINRWTIPAPVGGVMQPSAAGR